MEENVKVELEFVLKTSMKSLENLITTPSGLAEWFANNVNIKDDVFTFYWDKSEEQARLLSVKKGAGIKWRWLEYENEPNANDYFFEIAYRTDPMTGDVILSVTDVNPPHADETEIKDLWDESISDLRGVLGA